MDRIPLQAEERTILGKKVKKLRLDGFIPGHVFGNKLKNEDVAVKLVDFRKVFKEAGETGVIDLKIGAEKIRPVMIRGIQVDPVKGNPLHVDFYQVDLTKTVVVPVPIVLIGEEPALVHAGEAVVIQPTNEVEVEALPADIPENIEVDISKLLAIGDAVTVADLKIGEGVKILTESEVVLVKLDTAITEEMAKLMEEQAAESAAAVEAQVAEEGAEGVATAEGEEASTEGKVGETPSESGENNGAKPTDENASEPESK